MKRDRKKFDYSFFYLSLFVGDLVNARVSLSDTDDFIVSCK